MEPTFSLELPEPFLVRREGVNLQGICQDPAGVLHITPERVIDPESLPNLSRMLAGFLTRSGHPVATDELLQVTSVPDAHGFSWQYVEEKVYHRLWLFGDEFSWLLMTFICPESDRGHFHESLQAVVNSLRLRRDGRDP
jgi:hypothetical protein